MKTPSNGGSAEASREHDMRLAPPTYLLIAIIASTIIAPQATAQQAVGLVDIKDLARHPIAIDEMKKKRALFARSIVQVRVHHDLGPHIRPIGNQAYALGAATLIDDPRLESGPVLITAEFLVRGAKEVELIANGELLKAKVLRADLHFGLALIEAPRELLSQMIPLAIVPPGDKLISTRFYTLAHEVEGNLLIFNASLNGPGEGGLAFYTIAAPALAGGYPIITSRNVFYGLYTFRPVKQPDIGLVIGGDHISRFLDPLPSKRTHKKVLLRKLTNSRPAR